MRNSVSPKPATEENSSAIPVKHKPQNIPSSAQENHDTKTASNTTQSSELLTEPEIHSLGLSGIFCHRQSGSEGLQHGNSVEQTPCTQQNHVKDTGGGMCSCIPLRFVVISTVFLGMVIVSAMRTNVGVTVLTILNKDLHPISGNGSLIRADPHVDWSTLQIGFLHSAFYVGYMISHPPAGYLTTRIPSHKLLGVCIMVSCLLNLSLPVAIQLGGYFITITLRFLQGLSEGLLYPACYSILRHWSTPQERGRVGSLVLAGAHLGPAVGFPISGVITDYLGWQYVYYFNGGLGVVFVMVWAWLSEDKPAHHKQISTDELNFIEDLQGSEKVDYEGVPIPWGEILESLPVLSLCLCHFARNWMYVLCLTNEPYYVSMFDLSITENGLYSALPHVFKICAAVGSGLLADCLLTKGLMSTAGTRKLLTTGFGVQALFFYLLTWTQDKTVAMSFLTIAIGFGGFPVSGWQLNHYDLSARHASVLVAVTCTFGNLASVSAPIVTGIMTEARTFEGWNEVFYITAGIGTFSWICFSVFGSGERQSWAAPADKEHVIVKKDERRRSHHSLAGDATAASSSLTYSYLRTTADEDHVIHSHVTQHPSAHQYVEDESEPRPTRN